MVVGQTMEAAMPEIVPSKKPDLMPMAGTSLSNPMATGRRTGRALANVARNTMVRMASVQGHALVQSKKIREIADLGREAMTGQAMLRQWGSALAQGDPFLADDLKFFADVVKIGMGEVIADTIRDFGREGRR